MAKRYILFNPFAGNGQGAKEAERLRESVGEDARFCDMTEIADYKAFFLSLESEDTVVICGGDGTLNRFVNELDGEEVTNPLLYYPCGSGNDFAHDLGHKAGDMPFPINEYIKELPCVYVNGERHRFINGVGYGLDGYCCEAGDEIRRTSDKPINYTMIAIKGLLFRYKPTRARVVVDGVTSHYERVWVAPTMNGRFYGGGMMAAPEQKRIGGDGKLSVMVMHAAGKIRTLMVLPSIFKGKHVLKEKQVKILSGHDITVQFDRPVSLQIDGETITGVSEYRAVSQSARN